MFTKVIKLPNKNITPSINGNNNGNGLKIIDPNEILITSHLKKDLWKIRINNMVKAAKETLTSQWAAPIILAVLLGFVVYDRQSMNTSFNKQLAEQHDLLIELKTLQSVAEKEKERDRADKIEEKRLDGVYRERMTKDFNRLELIVQGKYPKESGGN